ncbi:MAG: methyltransferase domain-containing protein, partial [Gammaproteobacteria bacterium]
MANRYPLLGIIGGLRPLASAEFVQRLYAYAVELHCRTECELPRLLLASDPSLPDRTAALLKRSTTDNYKAIGEQLRAHAEWLFAAGADTIVLACMTGHCWLPSMPQPVLARIIDLRLVIAEACVEAKHVAKWYLAASAGTLANGELAALLEQRVGSERLIVPNASERSTIHEAFYALKQGDEARRWGSRILARMQEAGCDGLVLGCTEGILVPWPELADVRNVVEPLDRVARTWVNASRPYDRAVDRYTTAGKCGTIFCEERGVKKDKELARPASADETRRAGLMKDKPFEGIAGSAHWDSVVQRVSGKSNYLDAFLGELKRQAHLELIQRWGGLPRTGRILKTDLFEEAMGPDAYLTALSNNGGLAIGMDVSPAIAHRAQGHDPSLRACYVVADTRCLPFNNDSFALIVSPSTLDHFPDPHDLGRSLSELARVLEPAGRLIITLDNRQNIFDPLLRMVNRLGWVPYYLGRSYTVRELREELESAGFLVQETTAILHNLRLTAVGAVTLAKKLRWRPLMTLVQR